MFITRQPPASTHIVACVERMFFTSRSQPRIIIPHAARCCKPFFRILPNFFEKIWRTTPLTADFPPGGGLLFKTCRDFSVFWQADGIFQAFSSRGLSYHSFAQKKSPAGRFFPTGRILYIAGRSVFVAGRFSPRGPPHAARREMSSMGGGRGIRQEVFPFRFSFPLQEGSSLWCQPVASLIHSVVPSQATPGCSQGITSLPVSSSRPQLSPRRTAT